MGGAPPVLGLHQQQDTCSAQSMRACGRRVAGAAGPQPRPARHHAPRGVTRGLLPDSQWLCPRPPSPPRNSPTRPPCRPCAPNHSYILATAVRSCAALIDAGVNISVTTQAVDARITLACDGTFTDCAGPVEIYQVRPTHRPSACIAPIMGERRRAHAKFAPIAPSKGAEPEPHTRL